MDVATENRVDPEPIATGGRKPNQLLLRAALGAGAATVVNLATYSAAVLGGVSFRLDETTMEPVDELCAAAYQDVAIEPLLQLGDFTGEIALDDCVGACPTPGSHRKTS